MRAIPVQTSFAAGRLSERFIARADTKGYREGCLELDNMIPTPQGPAFRRRGLDFRFEPPEVLRYARVIPFTVASNKTFALVFGHLKYWVIDITGQPLGTELVTNGDFTAGSTGWTTNPGLGATVLFSGATARLKSTLLRTAVLQQQLAGLTIGFTYSLHVVQLGQTGRNVTRAPLRLRVGTAQGGSDQGELDSSDTTHSQLVFTATSVNPWIEVGSLATDKRATIALITVRRVLAPVSAASPYTLDQLPAVHFEANPAGTAMVLTHGDVAPQEVVYTPPSTFALGAIVFTAPPAEWVANSYPRTLTWFDGRLWFGGSKNNPSKFWASRSGAYYDMTLGTLANDGMAYTFAKRCEIRWMAGPKSLLIGTDVMEFVVSSQGGVITPTDITVEPQSAYGSAAVQPALLGNIVIFLSGDGRKLYSMGYRFEESGWVSTDLSFAAEDITEQRITAMAYAQSPDSSLMMLDAAGAMIGCAYERGNNVIGWHAHPTALLDFVSIATSKYHGTDVIWCAYKVERDDAYIQVGTMHGLIDNEAYMDSWKKSRLAAPALVHGGFAHLEGLTVQVIADGAVHPDVTVASGNVTLQSTAQEVRAGLACPSKLVTMPFEPGVSPQGSHAALKRFARAFIWLLRSAKNIINGRRPADRSPATPMGQREPVQTTKVYASALDAELTVTITIEEPLPIEMNVSAVFGDLEVNQA